MRAARAQLRALAIDEAPRFEIEFRLRQKEREFQQAILLAGRVRVEALADDGVVTPGQPLRLSVIVANRGLDRRQREAGAGSTGSKATRPAR